MTLAPPSSKYGNAVVVVGAGAAGYAHTADTVETLLASVLIPANTLPVGGALEITTLWAATVNGNTKTIRIRYGAANDLTGTQYYNDPRTGSPNIQDTRLIFNRAAASQIGNAANISGGFGASGGSQVTTAVDTTAASYVVFSGQCVTSGTDTVTLQAYVVRVIQGV